MGLLELCLLSVLSPQEPASTQDPPQPVAAPVPTVAIEVPQGTQDERTKLKTAELAGSKADPQVLGELASAANEKIAARAAWLLGRLAGEAAVTATNTVVTASPHATARCHAMGALLRHASVSSVPAAIAALEDPDRIVRTYAAQLLGKLKRPAAVTPLLALLERGDKDASKDTKATDVQAALIALHDLGAREHLLRAATALDRHPAVGAGEALAYCFQGLSPKLDRGQEVTLLVAMLNHREQLLRRYVIGRLGVLADPTTAVALEGRLATEGPELRPLVEVALGQVRHDRTAEASEGLQRVLDGAKAVAAKARARWDGLSENGRWIVGGAPVALLLLLMVAGRLRRRRGERAAAAATMALVAPSDEHLQDLATEAEALEAAAMAEAMAADAEAAAAAGVEDGDGAEEAVEDDGLVRR